jgi:hypothetical protein
MAAYKEVKIPSGAAKRQTTGAAPDISGTGLNIRLTYAEDPLNYTRIYDPFHGVDPIVGETVLMLDSGLTWNIIAVAKTADNANMRLKML